MVRAKGSRPSELGGRFGSCTENDNGLNKRNTSVSPQPPQARAVLLGRDSGPEARLLPPGCCTDKPSRVFVCTRGRRRGRGAQPLLLRATTRVWCQSLCPHPTVHRSHWPCGAAGSWEVWPLSGQPGAQLEMGRSVTTVGEGDRGSSGGLCSRLCLRPCLESMVSGTCCLGTRAALNPRARQGGPLHTRCLVSGHLGSHNWPALQAP